MKMLPLLKIILIQQWHNDTQRTLINWKTKILENLFRTHEHIITVKVTKLNQSWRINIWTADCYLQRNHSEDHSHESPIVSPAVRLTFFWALGNRCVLTLGSREIRLKIRISGLHLWGNTCFNQFWWDYLNCKTLWILSILNSSYLWRSWWYILFSSSVTYF